MSSVHELFRSWFRFKGSCSCTGFTGSMGPGRISARRSTSAFNAPLKGQSLHAVFPTVCRQTWDCLSYHLLVSPLFAESCSWSQLNLHSVSSRRPMRKILVPSPREHQEKTQRISSHFSLYSTRATDTTIHHRSGRGRAPPHMQ